MPGPSGGAGCSLTAGGNSVLRRPCRVGSWTRKLRTGELTTHVGQFYWWVCLTHVPFRRVTKGR